MCKLEIKWRPKINDNSAKTCTLGIPLQKEPGLLKEGDFNLGQKIFMRLLGSVPQSKESKQKKILRSCHIDTGAIVKRFQLAENG